MKKPDPLIGRTFEKVRLIERLGSGGMGTVYLAEHATLGNRVAVKILPDHLSRDPEYVSRFLAEAKTASKLEHPNIVQVHDIGFADGKYFIVMQYVEGESLQTIVNALGPLEPRDAAKALVGVLRGLHYAHGVGIVHRDIKPDNILISKDNQPRILDFGLAIETEATMKLTEAGTVVGTPWYISPEQARGHRSEPPSDIYSAGVTLYFLLTGRVPFTAQTALAVLNKHIHETPVSPMTLNPRIPPVLDAIVTKMMAKRPEDRYLTAETAARDLEAYLENRPISMARSAPPVTARMEAKKPAVWVGAGVLAVLLVVLTIIGLRTPSTTPPPRRNPDNASSVDPAARAEIESARAKVAELEADFEKDKADFAAYPHINARYPILRTQFSDNAEALKIINDSCQRFMGKVEERARLEAERVNTRVQTLMVTDPYAALEAYGEFPRPLLDICETGRLVNDARAKLEVKLEREIPSQTEGIERMIREEDFDAARARARYLLNHVATAYHAKLRELEVMADRTEESVRERLSPRLLAEIGGLEDQMREPLSHGQTSSAWKMLADYAAGKPANKTEGRMLRVAGVDTGAPKPRRLEDAIEGDLEREMLALSRAQTGDGPAFRLLLLFEDVLRWEWLQRRAARGIRQVAGASVAFETFGQARVDAGNPPQVTPEGGAARTLDTRELAPIDVLRLAAAAEYAGEDPVAEAYRSNDRLGAGAGVLYLHSNVRDRFNAARRWLERSHAIGTSVPRFRRDALEHEARLEEERLARELLGPAAALADQGKFEEAARAIEDVQKQYRDRDLMRTLGRLIEAQRARIMFKEAAAARTAKNWKRAREVVTQLRRKFDDGYDHAAADRLYYEATFYLGSWQKAPIPEVDLSRSPFWTWADRVQGAPPPAKLADGGLNLTRNLPIFCVAEKTEGYTGLAAKVRLNAPRTPFNVGFRFDVTSDFMNEKWLLATSEGDLVLSELQNRMVQRTERRDLPVKITRGEWHELAFVAEDGEIIVYFDGQPVFATKGEISPKSMLGLTAEGDFTFKDIRIRDMKPR